MSFLLGNLTTTQLQERLGITLKTSEILFLEECRQDKASDIESDKWHCFDIPFNLICGSRETAIKVYNILNPYSDLMQEKLQISIEQS
jgi:hypothetical protein